MTPVRLLERFGANLLDGTLRMGGFFVLAVLVAAFIKTWKWDKKIRRHLDRAGAWGIPLATAAGLVSPLCSCGILPVVASLMAAGVPTAPIMALLITSPIMSPDAFVLTWGVLGPGMAWGKIAGAAAFGLALGYLTRWLIRRGFVPESPWKGGPPDPDHHCVDPHDPDDPRRGYTVPIGRWRYFGLMLMDMSWMIGRFMALALVLQALLVTLVSANTVKVLIGRPSVLSVLLAAAIGLPLPLHQVAAVPIVRGLLDMGANRGAAMALLMAGPVSSIPAIVFLSGLVNRRLLWAYLAVSFTGSILLGLLYLS